MTKFLQSPLLKKGRLGCPACTACRADGRLT